MARDRGIEVNVGYGMSETCPIISLANPKEHMLAWEPERQLDVVIKTGRPIPLVEIDLFDPEDRPLPHDGKAVGEVCMRASQDERWQARQEGAPSDACLTARG